MAEAAQALELRALIFDVDGTLADTERDGHRVAFNRAFAEAGLDWVWDEALYGELLAVTGGKERIRHYLDRFHPAELQRPDLPERIAALHRAKTRHYVEHVRRGGVPLRPGVARLLTEARAAGLKFAIATTTTPENVVVLLEHTLGAQRLRWFDCIGAGDAVAAKKPAPDIYRWVLERLALPPQACLAFEDSANGLAAARCAGVPAIVTVNPYTADQDFAGAALVLSDLGEPQRPFRCLAGDAAGHAWASVAALRRWHAQATATQAAA